MSNYIVNLTDSISKLCKLSIWLDCISLLLNLFILLSVEQNAEHYGCDVIFRT